MNHMRGWLNPAVLGIAIALCGCYNPDLIAPRYRCDISRGDADCPEGQRCVSGQCQIGGGPAVEDLTSTVPDDLASPRADLSRPPDLSTPDLMPPPDMTTPPCAGDAVLIKAGAVYGCRGAFNPGGAAGLCGQGYHLCKSSDSNVLKTLGGACDQNNGFFAADVDASIRSMGNNTSLRCMTAEQGNLPALMGCGRPHDGVIAECSGLSRYIICNRPGDFVCTSGLANTTYNGQNNGGALCCRN